MEIFTRFDSSSFSLASRISIPTMCPFSSRSTVTPSSISIESAILASLSLMYKASTSLLYSIFIVLLPKGSFSHGNGNNEDMVRFLFKGNPQKSAACTFKCVCPAFYTRLCELWLFYRYLSLFLCYFPLFHSPSGMAVKFYGFHNNKLTFFIEQINLESIENNSASNMLT